MSILTPNHTVTPRPYETRFVGDTIAAITVATDCDGFITVNNPRTVYWVKDGVYNAYGITIRAKDPRNTLKCEADTFGIVTIFYKDGRIESDPNHLNTLD